MEGLPREGRPFSFFGYPLPAGKGTDLRLALGVVEIAKFGAGAAGDLRHFVAGLEAGEVRPLAPGERTAELDAGLDGGVVHHVDGALVVGIALPIAGEIAEVA